MADGGVALQERDGRGRPVGELAGNSKADYAAANDLPYVNVVLNDVLHENSRERRELIRQLRKQILSAW